VCELPAAAPGHGWLISAPVLHEVVVWTGCQASSWCCARVQQDLRCRQNCPVTLQGRVVVGMRIVAHEAGAMWLVMVYPKGPMLRRLQVFVALYTLCV